MREKKTCVGLGNSGSWAKRLQAPNTKGPGLCSSESVQLLCMTSLLIVTKLLHLSSIYYGQELL